jgi:trigger factor
MALIKQEKTGDGLCELTARIGSAEFENAVEKAYRRDGRKLNIQGFRKGKAPRAIIERMYGQDFFHEAAINDLLPAEYDAVVDEAGVDVIGRPQIEVAETSKEEGVTVVIRVKLRPELGVGSYRGIPGVRTANTVGDAEIEAELESRREKASRMVAVEDRGAQDGDIACIDFEGFLGGKPFDGGKGEHYDLTLGSGQFIPGFEEQLVGHKAGEEFEISVRFPDEYASKKLAGQNTVFKVKLCELHRKEMPEIDDEFAKDVSEFDTLSELREDIKSGILKRKDEHSKQKLEEELVEAVAATLEGDIPEEMVEDSADEIARDFARRLEMQGMSLKTYLKYSGGGADALRESFRSQAVKHLRRRLALEAVARAENISVTPEEIEEEIARMASDYDTTAENVRAAVSERGVAADIRVRKAVDVIAASAKVTEEKAKNNSEAGGEE